MMKFSNIQEVEACLKKIYEAKSGSSSQAIADVEFQQGELYKIANNNWKELVRIINDKNNSIPDFKSDILWALRDVQEKEVVNLFKNILAYDSKWEMRYSAIEALSRLKNIDLTDAFVQSLNDSDSLVQFTAVTYLEKYGDHRAISNLEKIVKNKKLQQACPGMIDSAMRTLKRIKAI